MVRLGTRQRNARSIVMGALMTPRSAKVVTNVSSCAAQPGREIDLNS